MRSTALDAGRGARLAAEALDGLRVLRGAAVQQLEGQLVAGARVLDDVHDAHTAAPELAHDPVPRGDERRNGVLRQGMRRNPTTVKDG